MDLLKVLQQRYTTKAYDASKVIPQPEFDQLLEVLKLTPSSINIQPWHFFVAATDSAKQRIATALVGDYAYNAPKVLNASHTIVFCSKTDINQEHLSNIINKEAQDGRFKDQQVQQNQMNSRAFYVDYYRQVQGDVSRWTENQTFIALGQLLLAAAVQGIDATPIGGFNAEILTQELKLTEQGLKPSVIVALGYRSEQDFNAPLPKSRLQREKIISILP
ncbi:oxygen-insensitive NAD(P)H nitroreductase [Acinetobacter rudis]|uniref:oxygen-insensitive NAD(P)H nitroreductase n=1 Tax=Acinetobacter rudis TaxID=632955 RepID=UPI00281012AE|nr:oxygen-insensitive NAD(P)H nitroreductase [Acinetobacter rudis]MDQ8954082.1 oxygen-insensitive NAD(P)H nitroreductase [Acinetobacter rudis]